VRINDDVRHDPVSAERHVLCWHNHTHHTLLAMSTAALVAEFRATHLTEAHFAKALASSHVPFIHVDAIHLAVMVHVAFERHILVLFLNLGLCQNTIANLNLLARAFDHADDGSGVPRRDHRVLFNDAVVVQ